MLETFYERNREEVKDLILEFLNKDFYTTFPELKGVVIIIATGSVGSAKYDKYSDIDLKIIFPNREMISKYKDLFKEYKLHIRTIGEPIQLHTADVLVDIENKLELWSDDHLLREMSRALVIEDPKGEFADLQKKYYFYPQEIKEEKLRWLYAELILQIEDRWKTAKIRNSLYFCETIKIQVIKLVSAVFMIHNNHFPSYDKHLYQDVVSLDNLPEGFVKVVVTLLVEHEIDIVEGLLNDLRIYAEEVLLQNDVIGKDSNDYWLSYRAKYRVTL